MNRSTRDKFASGTQAEVTSGNACWETPPAVYAKLCEDFGPFDIDLTADARRALCPLWFGPGSPVGEEDALKANWGANGRRGYSNPPYGPFVQVMLWYAWLEALRSDGGFTTVLLLPMRVTKAFRLYVLEGAAELWFCDKRITFWENGAPRLNPKTGKPDPALFDSIVVVFRPAHVGAPKVGAWHVPPHDGRISSRRAAIDPPRGVPKADACPRATSLLF